MIVVVAISFFGNRTIKHNMFVDRSIQYTVYTVCCRGAFGLFRQQQQQKKNLNSFTCARTWLTFFFSFIHFSRTHFYSIFILLLFQFGANALALSIHHQQCRAYGSVQANKLFDTNVCVCVCISIMMMIRIDGKFFLFLFWVRNDRMSAK